MKLVRHTVRLPIALDKSLRTLAERQGVSVYAMLQRSVKAGIAAQENPSAPDIASREIVAELALVSTRIVDVERMLDRALFTACAAYCYARSAAMGARKTDEVITAEINAAYDRQRLLSQEVKRSELAAGGLLVAGIFAIVGWAVASPVEPSKAESNKQSTKSSYTEDSKTSAANPWIRPESIVEFPKGEVACINRDDLQQALVLGLSGRSTKSQAYFEDQDGSGPRCIMLPAGMPFKVIDAEYNDESRPESVLLEVVGLEIKASESGAFVPVLDRSMVKIIKSPPERP